MHFLLCLALFYNSDDGIGLRGNAEIPLGKSGEAYFDYNGIQKPDLSLKLDIAISYLGELHPSGIVKYPMNIMMKLYG